MERRMFRWELAGSTLGEVNFVFIADDKEKRRIDWLIRDSVYTICLLTEKYNQEIKVEPGIKR